MHCRTTTLPNSPRGVGAKRTVVQNHSAAILWGVIHDEKRNGTQSTRKEQRGAGTATCNFTFGSCRKQL